MEVELPKDTSDKVNHAASILGLGKNDLVDRAVQVYLDSIDKYMDLKNEFKKWDALSDEALLDFESSL